MAISLSLFGIDFTVYAATPFFANDAFTKNGIDWCDENLQLFQILGDKFFEHHKHSIESRVCVSLYNDPLWSYDGPDRYEKLIERSRYYVELEIAESAEEAKTGVIDTTPAKETETESELGEIFPQQEEMKKEIPSDQTSGGGCLIATSTYGTELASEVQQLRELRDNIVLETNSGKAFMKSFNEFYYSFSPTVADLERENPLFRQAVKLGITPLVFSLSILNHIDIDSDAEMLGYGIGIILLNVGMYFVAPTLVVVRLINRKYS